MVVRLVQAAGLAARGGPAMRISSSAPLVSAPSRRPEASMGRRPATTAATGAMRPAKVGDRDEDDGGGLPESFILSKARHSRPQYKDPNSEDVPTSRAVSIGVSLTCFMVYFFFLREENDLDEELRKPLYDRIEGLEKANVLASINYFERNGLDSRDLRRRLKEILEEEEAAKAAQKSKV